MFAGNMYDHYFEKYKPNLFVVASLGHMIDAQFMRSANRNNCKVVAVLRNFDSPTTKDYRGAHIDHVVAWNQEMKREVNVFHDIPNKRIFLGGVAHWDFYFDGRFKPRSKEVFLLENRLPKNRKIIFYATSGFKTFRRTLDTVELLLEANRKNRFNDPVAFLIRMHPAYLSSDGKGKEQYIDRYNGKIERLAREYGDSVSFVQPRLKRLNDGIDTSLEDLFLLAETLVHADVLLTEYSTVMIEAAIFDLPIINVGLFGYRDTVKPLRYLETFTHIRRLLKPGASKNAYTLDQLVAFINDYLKAPEMESEQRKALVRQEASVNAGCAGDATGKILLNLLGGSINDDGPGPIPGKHTPQS